ncbi:hypothetical protein [Bacillus cereus group sp. BfR-BA-01354]|uniref:hypothetical protein n=1 Tax=Bacillus cereus group TaxID=86661 RepID=UPI001F59E322
MLLNLETGYEINDEEKQILDEKIDQTLSLHIENSALMNRLVMDSVTALTTSKARSEVLANQGFFKRFLGGITGTNNKIRSQIDNDLVKAQYASQQLIQKLSELNFLTFDTIAMVNNKLNAFVLETDEEINRIYETLVKFFKQTRAEHIQLENRITTLERNMQLLHWQSTIEYQMYNGIEYHELQDIEKICCITNDFIQISEGKWSTSDLLLLKPILKELGMSDKTKISYEYFIKSIIQRPILLEKLFEGIPQNNVSELSTWEIPILKGIEKSTELKLADKYIIDTITQQLELAQVSVDKDELKSQIVQNYMKLTVAMDLKQEITLFELIIELLLSLKVVSNYDNKVINNHAIIIHDENVIESGGDFKELEVEDARLKLHDYIQLGEEGGILNTKYSWQVIKVENDKCLLWSNTPVFVQSDGKHWSESSTREVLNEPENSQMMVPSFINYFSKEEKALMLPTEVETIISANLFEGHLKEYLEQEDKCQTVITKDLIFSLSLHELKTLVYDQNISYRKKETYLLRDVSIENEFDSIVSYVGNKINTVGYPLEFASNPISWTYPAVYISNIKFPYGNGREDNPYRMVE